VYKLGALFGSGVHRVTLRSTKLHRWLVKNGGDVGIKDYVVFQKPQEQDNRLPPPRTLPYSVWAIKFANLTYSSRVTGQLTHTRCSDGAPESVHDSWYSVQTAYMMIYSRLLFLHSHREASDLANELPEESDQFRFLRAACLGNLRIRWEISLMVVPMCERRVNLLVCSLPLHRHSYIGFIFSFHFIDS
jgi:hypothetical protein